MCWHHNQFERPSEAWNCCSSLFYLIFCLFFLFARECHLTVLPEYNPIQSLDEGLKPLQISYTTKISSRGLWWARVSTNLTLIAFSSAKVTKSSVISWVSFFVSLLLILRLTFKISSFFLMDLQWRIIKALYFLSSVKQSTGDLNLNYCPFLLRKSSGQKVQFLIQARCREFRFSFWLVSKRLLKVSKNKVVNFILYTFLQFTNLFWMILPVENPLFW